ncbi:MAG TPA: MFS transporter [Spirochaetia bacterium]|nr:MFS transporter [Spirochaetia bacterium]
MSTRGEIAKESKFQLGNVVTIAIGHLIHDIYSAFLAPILPLLIRKFGLSYTMAGMLTVFQNMASLLNPFIGVLADRISVRYMVIAAPTVTATVMSLLPLSPSYTFLVVMLLITSLSAACWHVPAPVIIRHVAAARLGTGMSFFMMGGELARSLGPIIILGAISLWGMEGTYRMIPFGVAASLLLFFKLKNVPIRSTGHSQSFGKVRLTQVFIRLRALFLIMTGITFARTIISRTLNSFLPTYLTEKGSSLWLSGISLSVLELAGAVGVFAAGAISDRIGRRRMLLIIMTGTPILMTLFLLSSGFWLLPVLVLLGFFTFSSTPITLALIQENAQDYPAAANGIVMSLNFFIGSLAVVIIGMLSDLMGMERAYWLCALMSLIGIPSVLMLPKD